MSFENDIPFGVKASNVSSVASFASTLDDSCILIIANNCNENVDNGNNYDFVYNDVSRAAVYGSVSYLNKQQAYIGVKTNHITNKLATFSEDVIELGINTILKGDLLPETHVSYDLGSIEQSWKNIHTENINAEKIDVKSLTLNGSTITNFSDLGTGGGGGLTTNSFGDVKIVGTLEVDDIVVNNHISILNRSIYSSECLDIVNYTNKPTFNVKQIGEGDVFKISNDYVNVFTMKNNGFFGNVQDPQHNIDIEGSVRALEFHGDGTNLNNVNLSDRTTTDLAEGDNKYFTDERVSNVLWNKDYFSSNPFYKYVDDVEKNAIGVMEELRYAVFGINLDKIYQGYSNKYIVNNIYNDSMIINGTLRVKNIELIDDYDQSIDALYREGLYDNSNAISNYDFGAGRVTTETVSNVVYGILGHVELQDVYDLTVVNESVNNSIISASSAFADDITYINTNILDIYNNIDVLQNTIQNTVPNTNLDTMMQGTSNKYIENNLYDNSLYINGTLTVKNIEIVDIENFYDVFQTSLPETSDYFMNVDRVKTIVEEVLVQKNFEGQINNTYEFMSFNLESEKTNLVNRLNTQANEITLLQSEVETLRLELQNALSRIVALETPPM